MPFVRSDAASSLKSTQARFLLDLTGLEERSADQRRRAFRLPPHGSIEERWQVYACGYVARLVDALAGEHPATRRILGEDAFGSLVSRYVVACPPRSHDLAHAGERLPRFLESDPLTARLPFLPDLALLERRVGEAFVARDSEPLAWETLQALPPERVATVRFRPRPGTALVSSRWPIHDLWRLRDLDDTEIDVALDGRPQDVLVHRTGLVVRCDLVTAPEARLLTQALPWCRSLSCLVPRTGGEPADVLLSFKRLVERGVFTNQTDPEETGPAL